jgi:DNA-binding transcriptional MerR regulator/effector-binding domain-containing protein
MTLRLSIGEFSRITGLSVKALRFYHEKGLLEPAHVDPATKYRSYDESQIDRARLILRLKDLQFPLEEVKDMLGRCNDESDVLGQFNRQKDFLAQRIRDDKKAIRALEEVILREREAKELAEHPGTLVEEKRLPPLLVGGIRMRGKYSDCGKGFATLGKTLGRHLAGKPICLYYDEEYREEDADFEPCFPLRREFRAPGIEVRTLPEARCVSLLHKGPYDTLGRSYGKLLHYARDRNLRVTSPAR